MANEEEKGYPISDQQVDKEGFSDAHSRTLNSSNPALSNLKSVGLTGELPKIESLPKVSPPKQEVPGKETSVRTEQPPNAETTDQLSDFTKWLTQLDRPTVHPHEETIDAVEHHNPEDRIEAPVKSEATVEPPPEVKAEKKADKKKKRKKKKKKAGKKKSLSDQTIELSEDVFSETLAELLASQGHRAEAISMYEKLRLKYPEKSRFFAAKIEELNKKA